MHWCKETIESLHRVVAEQEEELAALRKELGNPPLDWQALKADNESLRGGAEIEALKADRDVWRQKTIELGLETSAKDKLLKQCKDTLEVLAKLGNGNAYGNSRGNEIAIRALAAIEKEGL
jgi:hypothetical protein